MGRVMVGRNPDGSPKYVDDSEPDRGNAPAGDSTRVLKKLSDPTNEFDWMMYSIDNGDDDSVVMARIANARAALERRRDRILSEGKNPSKIEQLALESLRSSMHSANRARITRMRLLAILLVVVVIAMFGKAAGAVFVLALIVVGFVLEANRRGGHAKAISRLEGEHCPACQFSLVGLPPAVPVELAQIDFGPQMCPECGQPWPKIPPY